MSARDVERETAAGGYTGTRQYDLENRRSGTQSHMIVNVACDPNGSILFHEVSKEGWNSGNGALSKSLETESEISRPSIRPMTLFNENNYAFQMIGTALLNGRNAYVIDVVPKRREVYLLRGKIWVDVEDYALARIDGQLATTASYWVRAVHLTLEFRKSGEYWFPWSSTSTSEVRVFGPTDVNIQFLDYSPLSEPGGKQSDLSSMEASYVNH